MKFSTYWGYSRITHTQHLHCVALSLAPPADYLQAVQASSVLACIFSILGIFVFVAQLFTLSKGQRFTVSGIFQLLASEYFFYIFPCSPSRRIFPIFLSFCHSLPWLMSMSLSLQACASWSQPPSTQIASTSMRVLWAGTVTATSWRGSPLASRSSPPSFTLCYARRLHEKDTRALAGYTLSASPRWDRFRTSDLSC